MTFPNLPVATMRVDRITQRDSTQRGTCGTRTETLLPVVDLSPLVMAIWSEWTIWDIRGRLSKGGRFSVGSHEQQGNAGIAVPVQEERPSTCQHVHQRLSRCLRRLKSPLCSGWTRRPSRAGRKQESLRPSGRSAATAGTGRRRSGRFWRASRSSAQNRRGHCPAAQCRVPAGAQSCAISQRPQCRQEGGVDPGGQLTASGGAFRVDAIVGIGQQDVAGVDPASWR
jgi:hypothetical protein